MMALTLTRFWRQCRISDQRGGRQREPGEPRAYRGAGGHRERSARPVHRSGATGRAGERSSGCSRPGGTGQPGGVAQLRRPLRGDGARSGGGIRRVRFRQGRSGTGRVHRCPNRLPDRPSAHRLRGMAGRPAGIRAARPVLERDGGLCTDLRLFGACRTREGTIRANLARPGRSGRSATGQRRPQPLAAGAARGPAQRERARRQPPVRWRPLAGTAQRTEIRRVSAP